MTSLAPELELPESGSCFKHERSHLLFLSSPFIKASAMFRPRGIPSLAARSQLHPLRALRPAIGVGASSILQKHPFNLTRAWESSTATDNSNQADVKVKDDGHIGVQSNESVLFFDNLFPLKLSNILNRAWRTDQDMAQLLQQYESSSLGLMDPIRLVKRAIPEDLKVTEILPRLKDGGAFVKFQHDVSLDPLRAEGKSHSQGCH